MLITKIVAEVDAQLERLEAARARIVELMGEPGVSEVVKEPSQAAEPTMTGRVAAHMPRGQRAVRRRREVEPSALGKSIPAGPVAVSASAVQQRAVVAAKPAAVEPRAESGFEALMREAAERSRAIVN